MASGSALKVRVEPLTGAAMERWLPMRRKLWPHCSDAEHVAEMRDLLSEPQRFAQFIAYSASGEAAGFAEASIRHDYVNGTISSPVAFLEGIYVEPDHRRAGLARSLVAAIGAWCAAHGTTELASDADLANDLSHRFHKALGFQETERVVFFRKPLETDADC
jgi:aminoglycoside 6'-N-acetyltransferase I